MNYSLVIEDRKSTREYKKKAVGADVGDAIRAYHDNGCMRLFPEINTEIFITGSEDKEKLEGAAGYKEFIAGSPSYMLLLTEPHEYSGINAGYMAEDISLMLIDKGYGVCFVTFSDSDAVKRVIGIESEKEVAAILAFGNPERARKKMHVNLLTMAGISFREKQQYFAPKKGALDLAYVACGRSDVFFEFQMSPWDVAAGALLVTEAGGHYQSFGHDHPYFEGVSGAIACNTACKDAAWEILKPYLEK